MQLHSGARVISMSWGGATQDSTLTNVIQAAVAAGRILGSLYPEMMEIVLQIILHLFRV